MNLVLHDVPNDKLNLLLEMAKALGIRAVADTEKSSSEQEAIHAAIQRIENNSADLRVMEWSELKKFAYGK
jgi:hypothetical protein